MNGRRNSFTVCYNYVSTVCSISWVLVSVFPLNPDRWLDLELPMRRQTYGYLPIHRASPPIDWYQTTARW